MDKTSVVQKILALLQDQLESQKRAAQAAHAAATDPDSKAENKYDTRTLESSYLARGQALRVAELEQAVGHFMALPKVLETHVALGSLVAVETAGHLDYYFLGPAAGGTEVVVSGHEVLVITPGSPLGKQLLGKASGDRFLMQVGTQPQQVRVREVL